MFSAGVGQLDDLHTTKRAPETGMLEVKIGGPAYRIGISGGAASSRPQSKENVDLDFNVVQRGDAEMENRMNGRCTSGIFFDRWRSCCRVVICDDMVGKNIHTDDAYNLEWG